MKWLAICVCLGGALLVGALPKDHVAGLALTIATVVLATRAVPLPNGGRFSSFPVPVLVAAALPMVGTWYAIPLALLGSYLAGSGCSKERQENLYRVSLGLGAIAVFQGVVVTALPVSVSQEAAWLLNYFLGSLTFGLTYSSPEPTDSRESTAERLLRVRSDRAIRSLRIGMLGAGIFCLLFAARPGDWPFLLLFLPLLGLFELVAQNFLFRLKSEQAEQAIQDIAETRASVKATLKALDQSDQERLLLEQINRAMRDISSEHQAVKQLLACLKKLCPEAVALFFPVDPDTNQVQQGSVQGEALVSPPILASLASLARQTLREGRTVHRSRPGEGLYALACPIPGFGVLCAFQKETGYQENEVYLFEQLATKGAELLISARQREQERGRQLRLMSQVELLDLLSQTGRRLFDAPNRDHILAEFVAGLGRLVPHNLGLLRCREWRVAWSVGLNPLPVAPESAEGQLLDSLELPVNSDRTVRYLNERFFRERGISNARSGLLIAVPFDDVAASEILILCSESPSGYGSEHRDLISTLVGQMVSALLKTERLEALQHALSELADKQNQLIQSSKMTALGTMVAGVAHEINTPLGAIALSIESAQLQLEKRPREAEKKLNVALKALERIQALVDRLLVFSHKGSQDNGEDLHQLGVDDTAALETVIWETKALTEAELRQRAVSLECRLEPCVARGSLPELTQVLVNLVLNAAAATAERFPHQEGNRPPVIVSCGILSGPPQGDWCYLRVEDSGAGIKTEHLSRIFEPFFTTKPVGVGTGLGLSIAHQIVSSFGGQIQVSSEPNQGTTFMVLLKTAEEITTFDKARLTNKSARAVG